MLVVIVPAYNESKNIRRVVEGLRPLVDLVVVVNDGSKDNTSEQARLSGAVVLDHAVNRGQGAALETGQEYARRQKADRVVHFDGDGQFSVADIARALELMEQKQVDIVFGSRFLGGPATRQGIPFFKRYFTLPLARYVDRILTGLSLTDAHNGFRVLSAHALDEIRITQDRMAHATEIPYLVGRKKLSYAELDITVSYQVYGQRFSGAFRILRDLFFGGLINKK